MSQCVKHNQIKTLSGTYHFNGTVYQYRACPSCYTAKTNVKNALDRAAALIALG